MYSHSHGNRAVHRRASQGDRDRQPCHVITTLGLEGLDDTWAHILNEACATRARRGGDDMTKSNLLRIALAATLLLIALYTVLVVVD
ncbi:hypothetical protein [Phytoactinopolyspora endophytica]|uniref:hypothetical protein n=1 Tax=Phytoactinopolyspora endophytica TaxID=1642495 RepID=UPI00101C8E2A|nr:hypothetical protein [Phytoactinopolyspora endophytica]